MQLFTNQKSIISARALILMTTVHFGTSYALHVAAGLSDAAAGGRRLPLRRSSCLPVVAMDLHHHGRAQHHAQSTARHLRVLTVTTRIGAAVSVFFGLQQFFIVQDALWIGVVNLASGLVFLLIPKLYRFGDLVAPLVFILVAY